MPTVVPGYWECPRCKGSYECRERANWIPPRTEFSEEELKSQAKNRYENRYRNAFISGMFFLLGAYILYYPFSNLDISETWAIADIVIGVLTMFIAGALGISSLRTKKPSE